MSKKYKLKGAKKPEANYNYGTMPDGTPFIDIVGKVKLTVRFLHRYIDFYENGIIIFRFDRIENITYYPKTATGGVIK